MKKLTVSQLTTCALMAALMCILGPLSLPIGPVPISLTNLVVWLAAILLGAKLSAISVLIYLLLGLVGLPVFSGYAGGIGKLAGPTGGYLIGFIFMAFLCGLFYQKFANHRVLLIVLFFVGDLVDYVFGTAWFMSQMEMGLAASLSACVIPFIPLDLIKIVIAVFLGTTVRKALEKAGLIG